MPDCGHLFHCLRTGGALDSMKIPDGTRDRRGGGEDSFRERPVGSRLWLLSREKDAVLRGQPCTGPMLTEGWRGCIKAVLPTSVVCHAMRVGMLAFRFP